MRVKNTNTNEIITLTLVDYVTVKDLIKDEFRNINLNNVELVRKGKQIGVIVN